MSKRSSLITLTTGTQQSNRQVTNFGTGLAPSTTTPRRRQSDEVKVIEWPYCLHSKATDVHNIAYQFSKVELSERLVESSIFKEVLKALTGIILKGKVIAESGVYHLVTTTREVLIIPHRRLVEYIRQEFSLSSA